MTTLVTSDMIIAAKPCKQWHDDRVRETVPEPVDFATLMHDDRIPVADRVWVACKVGVIHDRDLRLFACECAVRALIYERQAGHEPDPISVDVADTALRFATGSIRIGDDMGVAYKRAMGVTRKAIADRTPVYAKKTCALAAHANARTAAYASATASVDAAVASAHCGDQIVARHDERDWQIRRLCEIARKP